METLSTILVLAALQLNLMKAQVAYADIQVPEPETAKTTEQVVKEYFADAPIMVRIAKCESGMRQFDEQGNVLKGTIDKADTGVFQISARWHPEAVGLESLEGNVRFARHLFEIDGTRPWNASRGCWASGAELGEVRRVDSSG